MINMQGNDKAYVWSCFDCSDEEHQTEKFAIRLQNLDNAKKFKETFEAAKQFNIDSKAGKEVVMAPVIEDKEEPVEEKKEEETKKEDEKKE